LSGGETFSYVVCHDGQACGYQGLYSLPLGGGSQDYSRECHCGGDTITTIAQALGHGGKFGTVEPPIVGGSLNIATLACMSIVDTKARTSKYPHHKQIIFAFFVVAQTTMFSKRN